MKVTTFHARDMREALKVVKERLGEEAIILSSRSVRVPGSGFSGGRTMIEVSACPSSNAAEHAATLTPSASSQETPKGGASSPPSWASVPKPVHVETQQGETVTATAGRFSRVVDDPIDYPPVAEAPPTTKNGWRGLWRTSPPPESRVTPEPPAIQKPPVVSGPSVVTEPYGLPAPHQGDGPDQGEDTRVTDVSASPHVGTLLTNMRAMADAPELDAEAKHQYSWLLMHGVEEPLARRLAVMDRPGKERGLAVAFQRALTFRDPLANEARVLVLVGPTGVGKTTTLAKIAADLILNRQRSVGMITLDTYRVGAVAQLETYANLLQVRLVVARSLSEVKAGLHALNRCDHVLVDTVGSSPYNRRQVNATAGLLPVMGEGKEVILCMAANIREAEQLAVYRRFSLLNPSGLLFTKLDETVTYGGILNVCIQANLPLTMYTDGQRVPENLGWMSAKTLARWFDQDFRPNAE